MMLWYVLAHVIHSQYVFIESLWEAWASECMTDLPTVASQDSTKEMISYVLLV